MDTLYCDDCGYEIREGEPRVPYSSLPTDVASANAGESAVLCRQCHVDLVQRVADDEWAQPLVDEIKRLRKERDEARREMCKGEAIIRLQRNRVHRDSEEVVRMAKEISVERGWDCFKKESN